MTRAALALALLAAAPAAARGDLTAVAATPPPAYAFQADKAVSASVGFALSGAGYAAGRLRLRDRAPWQARLGAAGVGVGLALVGGAAEELVRLRASDGAAGLNFAANLGGAVIGAGIALTIDFGVAR